MIQLIWSVKISWKIQVANSIRKLVPTSPLSIETNYAGWLSFSFGKSVSWFVLNTDFPGSLSGFDHVDNSCN